MASGLLDVKPLISHRIEFNNALQAYELLGDSSALGMVLSYSGDDETLEKRSIELRSNSIVSADQPVIGFLGAGNYASRTLIPAFKKAGAELHTLVSSGGVSSVHHGNKAGFKIASTREADVWGEDAINTAVIVTRHDKHANQVVEALNAGKHVFVEKPLALSLDELEYIDSIYQSQYAGANAPLLMVGFNRRFSPHIVKMKALLQASKQPKSFIITVNAGAIPEDHWTQDLNVGGGRIVGEGCHFIDLMRHLAGSSIISYYAVAMGGAPGVGVREDKASIVLEFADGSFGVIHYLANGGKAFPKERVEVFCGDAVLQLDNFRELKGYGWPGFNKLKLAKQNKGQNECVEAFVNTIKQGGPAPVPYEELVEVSRISIEVAESLR